MDFWSSWMGKLVCSRFDRQPACMLTRFITRTRPRSGNRYYQREAAYRQGLQTLYRWDWRSDDKNPQTRDVQRVSTLEGQDEWYQRCSDQGPDYAYRSCHF